MKRSTGLQALFPLGIGIVAIVLLSAGLSELELRPGQPFSLSRGEQVSVAQSGAGSETLTTLFRVVLILAGLLMPVALVYLIASRKARKRLFRDLVTLLVFFSVYYLAMRALRGAGRREAEPALALPQMQPLPSAPLAEFATAPPPWFVFAASLGLAVLLAALLVGVVRLVARRGRPPVSPLEQIAQDAQGAVTALQAGADLRNTVIRCYCEMCSTLTQQRGIRRQRAMTPREFGDRLTGVGLPAGYVAQITRLFEEVRYGTKIPGQHEERQAILCLRAIVEASRGLP